MITSRKTYWDELRQTGVSAPRSGPSDGYRRPDPRHCHDYGPAKPEVVVTPAIKAAMGRMESILAKRAAKQAADTMAKTMGVEALAPDEAELDAVDLW